jgi:hypothetical protein
MNILILIMLAFGITKIVNSGTIFDPLKNYLISKKCNLLVNLLNCPLCFGFWVGALVGYLYGPFFCWNIIFNGAFYSGCIWLLTCIVQFLGNGYDPSRAIVVNFDSPLEVKGDINKGSKILKG